MIDFASVKQYEKIFGRPKMRELWHEFLETSTQRWQESATSERETLRLIFHCFKSSSLVFGLTTLSELCADLENAILAGVPTADLRLQIIEAHAVYDRMVVEFSHYLETED